MARQRLERDLALRIPHIPITDAEGDDGLTLYLIVGGRPGAYEIDAIVSDGRAYHRTIDVDADLASRTIAADTAVLVHGIEDGTERPTAEGVDVEAIAAGAQPPPGPTEPRGVEGEPEPEPVPVAPKTDAPVDPHPSPQEAVSVSDEPPARPPPRPPPRLGLQVGAAVVGPVAPGGAPATAVVAGPELGFVAVLPRGWMVAAQLRAALRKAEATTLVRLRLGVGGGWAFRHKRFELPIYGLVTVEPWWVRATGRSLPLDDERDAPAQPSPLFGLAARFVPSAHWDFDEVVLRAGLALEVAASTELVGGAAVPRIHDWDGETATILFQLGGLELGAALELSLLWGMR